MAKARGEGTIGDWRHMILTVAVFVAIFGTLILGAMLQAGPDRDALARVAPAEVAEPPLPDTAPPAAATPRDDASSGPALSFSGDSDLVDRAVVDERRLGASGNGYTLQFAVVCEPDNVRANLKELDDEPSFYLLTMLHRDRACFRLCWGFYDTEGQARAERHFPAALGRVTTTPKVISIADALP